MTFNYIYMHSNNTLVASFMKVTSQEAKYKLKDVQLELRTSKLLYCTLVIKHKHENGGIFYHRLKKVFK